ncbi:MAG: hypothetical protein Q9224_006601 [Gallowayella concinna]
MTKVYTIDKNLNGIGDAARIALLQDTKIVTVRVGGGADAQSWKIHKKLLTHHSPYFAAAFDGSFSEATTDSIDMKEDDPRAFELFVQWLYTGKLFMSWDEPSTEFEIECKVKVPTVPEFASIVWALGGKPVCPAFQDHAMLLILTHFRNNWLEKDTAWHFYRVSPPGSRLRMLAVDQFLWDIKYWAFQFDMGDYIHGGTVHNISIADFTEDVVKRLIENRSDRPDPFEMGSRYLNVLDFEEYKKGF